MLPGTPSPEVLASRWTDCLWVGAQLLGHCGLAGAWSGRRIAGAQQACGGCVSEGNISSPDSPTEYVRMRSETCQLSFCDEVESSSRTPVLSPQSILPGPRGLCARCPRPSSLTTVRGAGLSLQLPQLVNEWQRASSKLCLSFISGSVPPCSGLPCSGLAWGSHGLRDVQLQLGF